MERKRLLLAVSLLILLNVLLGVAAAPPLVPPAPEKRIFIHYTPARPEKPDKPGKPPKDPHANHYSFLAKGAKWKTTPVTYFIDPDNPNDLSEEDVKNAIFLSAEEWEVHTDIELFSSSYAIDHSADWDDDEPDERNEIVFGNYPQANVIAVTVIWGIFSGPVSQRKIIEFDIMFDTDFNWGDGKANPLLMDLQNIATHELGHGLGLGDIYYCSFETMYGYSWEGDIQKRDLYTGDIAGIQELYGA